MIGVLALQGDFEKHTARLHELGAKTVLVNRREQLREVRGLVIPGGESSVLLKLSTPDFRTELKDVIGAGLPVLATCAGLILLATRVENPKQESLALLDVDVKRNAYGRQVDSFVDPSLHWSAAGKEALRQLGPARSEQLEAEPVEGVFIRAPRITRSAAPTLIERNGEPVLVKQGKILGATFHPELSEHARAVHELFLSL